MKIAGKVKTIATRTIVNNRQRRLSPLIRESDMRRARHRGSTEATRDPNEAPDQGSGPADRCAVDERPGLVSKSHPVVSLRKLNGAIDEVGSNHGRRHIVYEGAPARIVAVQQHQ